MSEFPRTVNGYTLTERLGSGGFAIAYQAEKDGQKFCVRQLKLGQTNQHLVQANDIDDVWKTWDLFKREADVLSQLDHPRIPKVFDYFTNEEGQNGDRNLVAYMAQTLIPGKNLRDLLSTQGKFNEEQMVEIGLQLCDILKYTHSQTPAVIHRDLKPSNIHQDSDGKIYLLDFGALQQEITKTCGGSTTFGTLGYAPLELGMGRAVTQSDLYMLGATFLHLLSGVHPEDMLELYPATGLPQLQYQQHYQFQNPSLELVIQQLTQPLPKDRIQTGEQVADYLQQIKSGKQLQFNGQKKASWFSRAVARLVPQGALEHLVRTRSDVVDSARQKRMLITGGEAPAPRQLASTLNEEDRITINGNLLDAYQHCVPGTMLCVDQLMTERRTNPDLRDLWFYTADGAVYSVDKGKPTLRITREAVNPVLKNIEAAFTQLTKKHNYRVTPADFMAVQTAPDTVTIDLSALRLSGNEKEWQYLTLDTKKGRQKLNEEESKLATRCGYIPENLQMLAEARIYETRIYILSPDYVQEEAQDAPLGRASWLGDFGDDSNFSARYRQRWPSSWGTS